MRPCHHPPTHTHTHAPPAPPPRPPTPPPPHASSTRPSRARPAPRKAVVRGHAQPDLLADPLRELGVGVRAGARLSRRNGILLGADEKVLLLTRRAPQARLRGIAADLSEGLVLGTASIMWARPAFTMLATYWPSRPAPGQRVDGRQQMLGAHLGDRGQAHGRGEDVVGGLPHVHVVIGVHALRRGSRSPRSRSCSCDVPEPVWKASMGSSSSALARRHLVPRPRHALGRVGVEKTQARRSPAPPRPSAARAGARPGPGPARPEPGSSPPPCASPSSTAPAEPPCVASVAAPAGGCTPPGPARRRGEFVLARERWLRLAFAPWTPLHFARAPRKSADPHVLIRSHPSLCTVLTRTQPARPRLRRRTARVTIRFCFSRCGTQEEQPGSRVALRRRVCCHVRDRRDAHRPRRRLPGRGPPSSSSSADLSVQSAVSRAGEKLLRGGGRAHRRASARPGDEPAGGRPARGPRPRARPERRSRDTLCSSG